MTIPEILRPSSGPGAMIFTFLHHHKYTNLFSIHKLICSRCLAPLKELFDSKFFHLFNLLCKGRGKAIPVLLTEQHAMKVYWYSGGRPFYLQGMGPWYSLYKRLGGPQSQSRRSGEEKEFLPLLGIEPWSPSDYTD
jgi:hypothetical protein